MPTEQPLPCERGAGVPRGIDHHLHHALHGTRGPGQRGLLDPEAARDGRADILRVEHFTLDCGGLHDIAGQCGQCRLGAQVKPQGGHPAGEQALPMTNIRQHAGKRVGVPEQGWPVR